jgi:hypothetical protein
VLSYFRIPIPNKTLWGIRPRRTKSCGVSDPEEQWQSCEHFIAYTCSAGSDTPRNKVLRGIKPRGTTFKNEYFCEFEKEFKNISRCEFRDYMGSIRGKNQRSKISCYCPFNVPDSILPSPHLPTACLHVTCLLPCFRLSCLCLTSSASGSCLKVTFYQSCSLLYLPPILPPPYLLHGLGPAYLPPVQGSNAEDVGAARDVAAQQTVCSFMFPVLVLLHSEKEKMFSSIVDVLTRQTLSHFIISFTGEETERKKNNLGFAAATLDNVYFPCWYR